jgi:uncharacterized membrane protein (UPF0127 family)
MDRIRIGKHIFSTLLAITASEQERGLMGVKWPPPVMTFVYKSPAYNSFWMKGTQSPLDIVFCLNNKITKICYGEPFSTKLIGNEISDIVIELPLGTCKASNINIGDEIEMEYSNDSLSKMSSFNK